MSPYAWLSHGDHMRKAAEGRPGNRGEQTGEPISAFRHGRARRSGVQFHRVAHTSARARGSLSNFLFGVGHAEPSGMRRFIEEEITRIGRWSANRE